ncbi:putative ubiquitin-conjugating enzyme/RWD [Helianthus anomalus]
MFECGEVRLKLSHQWTLPSGQIWVPLVTTVYDLLVAIRDKVLNADPLFHQPGFVECGFSVNFEAFVIGHFRNHAVDIMKEYTAYVNGLKAGNGEGNNG